MGTNELPDDLHCCGCWFCYSCTTMTQSYAIALCVLRVQLWLEMFTWITWTLSTNQAYENSSEFFISSRISSVWRRSAPKAGRLHSLVWKHFQFRSKTITHKWWKKEDFSFHIEMRRILFSQIVAVGIFTSKNAVRACVEGEDVHEGWGQRKQTRGWYKMNHVQLIRPFVRRACEECTGSLHLWVSLLLECSRGKFRCF